jgi:uncharacterized cofD-like protein
MKKHTTRTRRPKIVTIGGGTGHFTLLSGLKEHDVDITAIVAMADDGGSTGVLRDELGVLPPGDLRQCLVALSEGDDVVRALFTHRFAKGSLKGHTFGNIFISALEQVSGSIDRALDEVGHILKIKGTVLPVTRAKTRLVMKLKNGKVLRGEHAIDQYQLISRFGVASVMLRPAATLNPRAAQALREADLVVVGPGDLYTSLLPVFLVVGMKEAFTRSKAKKVFVANLMNKYGQTDGHSVGDFLDVFRSQVGQMPFTHALYNTTAIPKPLLRRYLDEGEPVVYDPAGCPTRVHCIGADLLATTTTRKTKGDTVTRSLIRHDPTKLAQALLSVV